MPHKIQTFRAATMDEALDLVRRELGKDAVVVESKEVATRRLLPWPSTRLEIEIRAEKTRRKSLRETRGPEPKSATGPRTIRTLAESATSTSTAPALFDPMPDFPKETAENDQPLCEQLAPPPPWVTATPRKMAPTEDAKLATIPPHANAYQQNLESLQTIVAQLERQSRPHGMNDLPSELFQCYCKLTAADIEDDVARDLIAKLRRQSSPELLGSPASIATMLTALIEREMRCAPPIKPQAGRREIVTLVGPTGVGKTTTLAKLAGHFHLREGLRVGLITVDTYRVGAVEQLRTYAEIMQIPLRTASNANELRTAIDEMDDVDLILIDTAGRSPFDQAKLNELQELLRVATSNHVLLVLSFAAGTQMLATVAEQFAIASPTSLVLTKLDEARSAGGLMSVARQVSHPVSYLTTGQDVPDQIEPAYPGRLARLILGRDVINGETRLTS